MNDEAIEIDHKTHVDDITMTRNLTSQNGINNPKQKVGTEKNVRRIGRIGKTREPVLGMIPRYRMVEGGLSGHQTMDQIRANGSKHDRELRVRNLEKARRKMTEKMTHGINHEKILGRKKTIEKREGRGEGIDREFDLHNSARTEEIPRP